MAATTFFANTGRVYIVTGDTEIDASAGFTAGSTSVTSLSVLPAAGDYIYNYTNDTTLEASRVKTAGAGTATLEYGYPGTTNATASCHKLTLLPLIVLKGVDTSWSAEHNELYGMDSILRVDVAKHTSKVEWKVKYAKWNPDVTTDWLMSVLKPSGAPDGTITDTNYAYVGNAIITLRGVNGEYIEANIKDFFVENVPLSLPENDWVMRDLTGAAKKFRFANF